MSSSTPSTIEVDELAARVNEFHDISNDDDINNDSKNGEDKFDFFKRIICEIYYSSDPYVNCYHIDDTAIENKVQEHSAEWSLYNSLAYLIPAIIADTVLGAFGDKYGRQMNILLGIAGIAISEYSYSLALSYDVAAPYWITTVVGIFTALSYDVAAPYWITTVVGIFTGFTGYIAMVPVSCNAYLADITDDPQLLTIRSGIFSVAQSIASVFGGVVAALVNGISIPLAVDIEILMYIFAFIYTFWRIPQKPNIHELERRSRDITDDPQLLTIRSGIFSVAQSIASVFGGVVAALVNGISIPLAVDIEILMYIFAFIYTFWRIPQKPNIHELERRSRVSTLTSNTSNIYDVRTFFVELWHLLKLGFRTYIRRRIGHRRGQVINSFVFRRTGDDGLNWDSSDLGYWNGVGFLILIIGTLFGLLVFKKILHLRETTIIIIAIISSSIRTAIIAFAKEDWHMYVANVAGLFAGLVQPATVSFIVQIVPNEEVGRAFSLFGIGGDLSFIIANVVYSQVINSFVFRRTGDDGLNWDSSDLGYWNGVGFLILIIGTLFGLLVFKKILHLRETTIIIIAIISSSIRTAIIAFAKEDWHMYVANVAGLFAGLVQPATVSFIVQIVPNEEVGRAFSLFGIGGDLSFIIANVVYSNIYRLTIDWFPGFLFLFITFIQGIICLAMIWVHIQAEREGVFQVHEPPRDIQRAISEIGSDGRNREAPLQLKPKRKHGKEPISIYEHAMERGRVKDLHPIWSSHENVRDYSGSFY
uniref:MFS general substrate transporter n=1 Tax=Panagrolaimus sp. ES5 TaxID=591445 RepID=A0AC34FRP0_9BILA